MAGLSIFSRVMDNVFAYRLWQATHAAKKLIPLRKHNDLDSARRVLDVGCGPGTNTRLFRHADYVGIDINASYIRYARRHYRGTFFAADACTFDYPDSGFDFVLLNSLLHHIDDKGIRSLFSRVRERLTPDGHIHVLDLVMPSAPSISRFLARSDRGSYARSPEAWRSLFSEFFEPVILEPFSIAALGITLWNMVYFKGKRRS